jgi:fatty-acyl-CoA synthase
MYIGDWLSRWAEIAPERLALVDATTGRQWTYRELDDRSARLADVFRSRLGVKPGDRVALIATNGPEVFETLFACGKIGAAFVPLNWRLAVPELVAIARDCTPKVLVYGSDWAGAAVAVADGADVAGTVAISEEPHRSSDLLYEAAIEGAARATTYQVSQQDLAMILYTSGTTGRPKGVMVTWRQLLFNAVNTILACDLSVDDRCLAFLPLFHTGGINCLATPVFHRGGTVVLMPKFEPELAIDVMERWKVTITVAVPTMYQMLIEAGLADRNLPSLATLLCGGAPCPAPLIHQFLDLGYNFRQGYGLTEVGPNCFSLSPSHVRDHLGTVGQPIFHSEARVVTDRGAEAGAGEVGELWLRGPHVTAGYWNNPEASAAVLTTDGWFKTGDYVTRGADGFFSIVGRKKEMFISGGENVYPAEVENALAHHPAVLEVAVIGVRDERWGEVGLAAVVARDGMAAELDPERLKSWTRERLAPFKVPRHWRVVAELPKNSSGKVYKPALKELFG